MFELALEHATKKIDNRYFSVPVLTWDGVMRSRSYQERVYAYELYHQLRNYYDNNSSALGEYILHAELSKTGNEFFKTLNIRGCPDLLVHKVQTMDNHLVLELKPDFRARPVSGSGYTADLKKIKKFMEKGNYQNGTMLFFGDHQPERLSILKQITANKPSKGGHVEIWHHQIVGQPAKRLGYLPLSRIDS